MKYIIMAGGKYKNFEKPKQLLKVNGEILIERTIRLLKENGIKDIAISTNNPAFDYLDVEKLRHKNNYYNGDENKKRKSENNWLNAYYPTEEPACYLHGDVYYSDEAIKTIIETPVKDTMFFCVRDLQDGRPTGVNCKGREPLGYKVQNQKIFRSAINDLFEMLDDGFFKDGVEPISWHLYRWINKLTVTGGNKDYGFANSIFDTKGDYIVIDDYSTDVDNIKDIQKIENIIKRMKGEIEMNKVEVIERFTFSRFNELVNIQRKGVDKQGELFVGDIFECDKDIADYLLGENKLGRAFIKVIEVIPAKVEVKEEVKPVKKTATKKKTTLNKRKSLDK